MEAEKIEKLITQLDVGMRTINRIVATCGLILLIAATPSCLNDLKNYCLTRFSGRPERSYNLISGLYQNVSPKEAILSEREKMVERIPDRSLYS